ncbi:MAG: HIT domain-containing protein [Patescibacteria group bacterium]|nr:HIT domain-containing protein [Patescibacteria group bacterium]
MSKIERQMGILKQETESPECVFCKIISGESPSTNIAETEDSLSFMSLEGYPLIVTRRHVSGDISKNLYEVKDAFSLAVELIPYVEKAYGAKGLNVLSNIGEAAGQKIMHFHIHLIPNMEGERNVRLSITHQPERETVLEYARLIGESFRGAKNNASS